MFAQVMISKYLNRWANPNKNPNEISIKDGFPTKGTFIAHMISHEAEEKVCSKCGEEFETNRDLFCHKIHHGKTTCPSCDFEFFIEGFTPHELEEHYDNCYYGKAKRHNTCGICNIRFSTSKKFWCRERQVYAEDMAEWEMVRHVVECKHRRPVINGPKYQSEVSNRRDAKTCHACKRIVALNKSLRAHAVLHVLPRDDDYRCRLACGICNSVCQVTCDSRIQLANHIYENHMLIYSCPSGSCPGEKPETTSDDIPPSEEQTVCWSGNLQSYSDRSKKIEKFESKVIRIQSESSRIDSTEDEGVSKSDKQGMDSTVRRKRPSILRRRK